MRSLPVLLTLVGALLSACAKSSNPNGPSQQITTTTFQGTVAGSGAQLGALEIVIQATLTSSVAWFPFSWIATLHAQTPVGATGTLRLAGGMVTSLSGAYDGSTRAVSLSGGGFSLSGTVTGAGVLSGSYNGPGVSGGFSTLKSTGGVVTAYCGTFTSPEGGGLLNLEVSNTGSVHGVALGTGAPPCAITGQISGSALTLTSCEGNGATGQVGSGTVTGTTMNRSGAVNGVFAASADACSAPAPGSASSRTYAGPFNSQLTEVVTTVSPGATVTCSFSYTFAGALTIAIQTRSDGTVTGTGNARMVDTATGNTGPCAPRPSQDFAFPELTVSGGSGAIRVQGEFRGVGVNAVVTSTWSFNGSVSGPAISGTATRDLSGNNVIGSGTVTNSASATFPITLR